MWVPALPFLFIGACQTVLLWVHIGAWSLLAIPAWLVIGFAILCWPRKTR